MNLSNKILTTRMLVGAALSLGLAVAPPGLRVVLIRLLMWYRTSSWIVMAGRWYEIARYPNSFERGLRGGDCGLHTSR